jgi:hypothetical protein
MKLVKWAVIIIIGFLALRWILNLVAPPAAPDIGDGALYSGWPYAGPLYARGPVVYPWSPPRFPRARRAGPRPWVGQSYAGRG